MTGIPKKNENSVATKREAPIKIDPRIVAPEQDVPGTSAKTWNNPTRRAAWYVKSFREVQRGVLFCCVFDNNKGNTVNDQNNGNW